MKNGILYPTVVLLFSISIFAQVPTPRSMADTEIRDPNSMKMREIQLERIKRDSSRIKWTRRDKELNPKFNEIKADFEKIQQLQSSIITAYTSGNTINYTQISEASTEMAKKARNLNENLFVTNSEIKTGYQKEEKQKAVRELIIELDRTIGSFVSNPIFSNKKLLDSKLSEKAGIDLDNIIELSQRLAQAVQKFI